MSEDPKLFDAGDNNFFRYVGNDPLDKADPMGLETLTSEETDNRVANTIERLSQKVFEMLLDMGHQEQQMLRDMRDHPEYFIGNDGLGSVFESSLLHAAATREGLSATAKLLKFAPKISSGNSRMGLKHIMEEHGFNSKSSGSKFAQGANVEGLITEVAGRSGAGWRVEGNSRVLDRDMGRIIGTTRSGDTTNTLRVVTDSNGQVITAYPIEPPKISPATDSVGFKDPLNVNAMGNELKHN